MQDPPKSKITGSIADPLFLRQAARASSPNPRSLVSRSCEPGGARESRIVLGDGARVRRIVVPAREDPRVSSSQARARTHCVHWSTVAWPCSGIRRSSVAINVSGRSMKWRYSCFSSSTRSAIGASRATHSLVHIASISAIGHSQVADLPALRFHEHRTARATAPERFPHQAFEHLLRRLRLVGQIAEHGAAMRGQAPRDRGLGRRAPRKRAQRAGSCRSPVRPHTTRHRNACRHALEVGDHRASIGAIAAIEPAHVPADLGQHVRERGAALAPAPAIDERTPVARTVEKALVQMARDVAAHERRADFPAPRTAERCL